MAEKAFKSLVNLTRRLTIDNKKTPTVTVPAQETEPQVSSSRSRSRSRSCSPICQEVRAPSPIKPDSRSLIKYLDCDHVFEHLAPSRHHRPEGHDVVKYVPSECPDCAELADCSCCGAPFPTEVGADGQEETIRVCRRCIGCGCGGGRAPFAFCCEDERLFSEERKMDDTRRAFKDGYRAPITHGALAVMRWEDWLDSGGWLEGEGRLEGEGWMEGEEGWWCSDSDLDEPVSF